MTMELLFRSRVSTTPEEQPLSASLLPQTCPRSNSLSLPLVDQVGTLVSPRSSSLTRNLKLRFSKETRRTLPSSLLRLLPSIGRLISLSTLPPEHQLPRLIKDLRKRSMQLQEVSLMLEDLTSTNGLLLENKLELGSNSTGIMESPLTKSSSTIDRTSTIRSREELFDSITD